MKLIDLLVRELPKHGGWPRLVNSDLQGFLLKHKLSLCGLTDVFIEDWDGDKVYQEQYESAIAESKRPVWNGDGLPPVGCECEFQNFSDSPWTKVRVIHYNGDEVWLEPLNGAQSFVLGNPDGFRPIRTEAEQKREETETQLRICLIGTGAGITPLAAKGIYEAIAAGKIPHITLK